MKRLTFFTLVLFSFFGKAQHSDANDVLLIFAFLSRVEMTSMNDNAFFSIGPKVPLSDYDYVSLRGHINWWDTADKKFVVIPELDYIRVITDFEDNGNVITNLYTGAGISPYAVSPKFGIGIFHIFSAEAGYNFEYNTFKALPTKGFRFSLGINFML